MSTVVDSEADIKTDAEVLLAHVLDKQRSYFYTWPDSKLSAKQWQHYQEICVRRKTGEPVAYIVGAKGFWTLDLKVNKNVLIPRPETELLVEQVLNKVAKVDAKIADLGTGTGAIALALASERKYWQITATDMSELALSVALENAEKNGITNVCFVHGSWCDPLKGLSFDAVVSNPPYISKDDKHLNLGDVRFEPDNALVAAKDGLADIETIASEASSILNDEGWILVEHGYNQAASVRKVLEQFGFSSIASVKDLNEHERVTVGQKNAG